MIGKRRVSLLGVVATLLLPFSACKSTSSTVESSLGGTSGSGGNVPNLKREGARRVDVVYGCQTVN